MRKKNKMKEKKAKKTIKVRDLKPTKDVRGGNRRHRGHAFLGLNQQEDLRQALTKYQRQLHAASIKE